MAVEHLKSTSITNRDNASRKLTNAKILRGRVVEGVGVAEVSDDASIGSTYRMGSIPSNARISQVLLSCDAITGAAADIGLYKTTDEGGAVVDADFFASAQSIASALKNSDVTHESGVYGIEDKELEVWQALGLAKDPMCQYDVVATLTAAATDPGTLALQVRLAE